MQKKLNLTNANMKMLKTQIYNTLYTILHHPREPLRAYYYNNIHLSINLDFFSYFFEFITVFLFVIHFKPAKQQQS